MTLLQLEYALALKRMNSYSRAAKSVGISQPALSIQIRKLEEETGLTLFNRAQKKVQVTEVGEAFLDRAQLLLTQARQLREFAVILGEEFAGTINIGIIPTVAPYLLPLFLEPLHETFPRLKVRVKETITEEVIHGIKAGELDVGIIATPIESRISLSTIPLFYERFFLYVSQKHPLFDTEELDILQVPREDVWLLKEGNCLRNQVDDICNIGNPKEEGQNLFYFESNSIEALCRIVEYEGGVTVLPELTTLQFDSERESMIKSLKGPKRVREISLIYLPNHVRSSVITQIGKLIQGSIPSSLLEKGDSDLLHTHVRV